MEDYPETLDELRELAKMAEARSTDEDRGRVRGRVMKLGDGRLGFIDPRTGQFKLAQSSPNKERLIEVTEGYHGDSTPFPADEGFVPRRR